MIRRFKRIIAASLAVAPLFLLMLGAASWPESSLALDSTKSLPEYGHDVWQRDQGLPHNTIRAILQTRDGYLWLATEEGVVRFDGVRFKIFDSQNTREIGSNQIQFLSEDSRGALWIGTTEGLTRLQEHRFTAFTTKDGLADQTVSSICEDREGNIWIGTAAGLSRWTDNRFISYTTKEGLPNDSVRSIYEDRSGALWISTLGGLARLAGGNFESYTTEDGLPNDSVKSVYEDRSGTLWVNTIGGLARLKNQQFIIYTSSNGLLNDTVWSMLEDRNGTMWIGTDGGLNSFNDEALTAYTTEHGLPDNSVWYIYEDRTGALWLATAGGLGRLKNGKFSTYTTRDGLSDDVVLTVCEDIEGSLWIGTEVGGLNRLRDVKFATYSSADGLTNDAVWAVRQGSDGSLWTGTNGGGLNRFRDGKFTSYTTSDGLASNIVRALCEDESGSLWVGTPNGLSRFKGNKATTYTVEDGLSSNAIWAIEEDDETGLWIGTLGGLTNLKDGRFTVYTTRNGLSDDGVISLCVARDGDLWIGTRSGGLNKFEGGRFTAYRAKGWLADDSVRAIYEDADGVLWVGTRRSGLSRFKDGEFTTCTAKEGLFDNCVFRILEDERQDLWMSSPSGVFRVSKKELNEFAAGQATRVTSMAYGTADGMLSKECSGGQPGGWKSEDGKLWFPTVKGLAMIDPANMIVNSQPPPVVIERALVDNEQLTIDGKVELAPGKERYEFYYTALSLVAPEKVRFKYRLEGFDKDWIDAGTERVASYTHIPPGSYNFKVIACNNDGIWNESGASFQLYLRPYFYQTYWFYAVCASVLGLVGLGAYRVRVNRIRAKFSAVLDERNRMAREIHDTLAQGFVGIGLQLQAVERALPDEPDTAKQHLTLAQSMVSHSLVEARRSVWDLRSQALETNDLPTALAEAARQMTEGGSVKAEVRVAGERRRLSGPIENNALRIGQEALTNAIKHAQAQRVVIELTFGPDNLNLRVTDDGRGFDSEGVLATADGHFGLLGMHERVEHLGGRLSVKSRKGEGTEIIATIPIS